MEELGDNKSKWRGVGAPTNPGLRRMIVGAGIEMAVKVLFKNFTYTFNGQTYLQSGGGPTSTRVAMAVGQILMEYVLDKLRKMFSNTDPRLNCKLVDLILYVDDGRTFCNSMSWGTRFHEDRFIFERKTGARKT